MQSAPFLLITGTVETEHDLSVLCAALIGTTVEIQTNVHIATARQARETVIHCATAENYRLLPIITPSAQAAARIIHTCKALSLCCTIVHAGTTVYPASFTFSPSLLTYLSPSRVLAVGEAEEMTLTELEHALHNTAGDDVQAVVDSLYPMAQAWQAATFGPACAMAEDAPM